MYYFHIYLAFHTAHDSHMLKLHSLSSGNYTAASDTAAAKASTPSMSWVDGIGVMSVVCVFCDLSTYKDSAADHIRLLSLVNFSVPDRPLP